MIFRKVVKSDFLQIQNLYKVCLNFEMDMSLYNYLYEYNGHFCSSVCVVKGKIVGHNAIIPRKYLYKNQEVIIMGLSSGGMVDPLYSGVFLRLLKYCIKDFNGQGIIAFPNLNSEPFFTKLLKFDSISQNYFTINKEQLNLNYNGHFTPKIIMHPKSIENRVDDHVKNNYSKLRSGNSHIIYKKYHDSADIVFVSVFNNDFIQLLCNLFKKGFRELNLVFNNSKILSEIGFKNNGNNKFVYKWIDFKYNIVEFDCQMIDSDVF